MKICMFTNTYLPHVGGVARSVSFFAEDLRKRGHQLMIIAPTFPGCEEHDRTEAGIFRVPAIQKFNGSDFSVRIPSPFLVDEQIDSFRPDIIHSHHPYLLGDAALRAARRRNLPLLFTHHTLYEEYAHYLSENPDNMKRFAVFLSTNYANLCDRVIAPSESIRDLIRERGVDVPVTVIPTGTDIPFFAQGEGKGFRRKYDIPETSFVIGHLGRLAPEKNLDYLAKALVPVLKKEKDSRFLVAGAGPSADNIAQIFHGSGIRNRLVLTGKVTGQDLADAYQAMDIFAFSSLSETQGMVLTEAMAAGVPVIALDAPGAREVVRDGKNGRLLDRDAGEDQFADAVLDAMRESEKMLLWIKNAEKTALSFGRKKTVEKLQQLYADAMREKQGEGNNKSGNLDLWDKFLLACNAEWELAVQKAESVMQTVDETQEVVGLDESDESYY